MKTLTLKVEVGPGEDAEAFKSWLLGIVAEEAKCNPHIKVLDAKVSAVAKEPA